MDLSACHVAQVLRSLTQSNGGRTLTVCETRELPRADFVKRVMLLSSGLTCMGMDIGERASIAALNSDMYLEWLLAVPSAGGIVTPLNHRWSIEEAAAAVNQVSSSVLAVDEHCASWWLELCARCPSLRFGIFLGPPADTPPGLTSLETVIELQQLTEQPLKLDFSRSPDGVALICFTSGTTGTPKGAALTHTALVTQSLAKLAAVGYNAQDVYMHAAPLCHIGGISSALAALMAGAVHVIIPRFRPDEAMHVMRKWHVTAFIAVPAMLSDFIRHCQSADRDDDDDAGMGGPFRRVSKLLVGGGGMAESVAEQVAQLFPRACIMSAYGMTEAASSITFQMVRESPACALAPPVAWRFGIEGLGRPATDPSAEEAGGLRRGVCVGVPAPHVEVKIVPLESTSGTREEVWGARPALQARDPEGCLEAGPEASGSQRVVQWDTWGRGKAGPGTEWELGQRGQTGQEVEGEVWTRGPHVMVGYWGQPGETAQALSSDGWLRTGDVGLMDGAGRLWLRGRAKDVVKSGGENVHAAEVEAVLSQHPGVATAAVVGLPSPRLGEVVSAAVTLQPGWGWAGEDEVTAMTGGGVHVVNCSTGQDFVLTPGTLQEHCRVFGLSRYKVPRVVVQLSELPLTSTGKVKKDRVRHALLASGVGKELCHHLEVGHAIVSKL